MQSHKQSDKEPLDESQRYEALLEMADLMVRHHSLPELFQDIADRLRSVAVFQLLNFSLYDAREDAMRLRANGIRTYYVVPLTTSQSRWGALEVATNEAYAYQEADKRLLGRVGELAAWRWKTR